MKKTLRIGNYELIFDSRLLVAPIAKTPESDEYKYLPPNERYPYPAGSLHEKVERANAFREQGVPFNYRAPDLVEQGEEQRKAEAAEAEAIRRHNNMVENERITGRHFFGTSVFYRTPTIYGGLKSWVFRNTSKEYSFSIMDVRKRTKIQNRYQRNEKDMQRRTSLMGQRGPGPTV